MVQVNLAAAIFLLATVITSSVAYPLSADAVELQEREPIRVGGAIRAIRHAPRPNSRQIRKGARRAGRVIDTVNTISSLTQGRREFDDEAPELTARKWRKYRDGRGD